MTRTTPSTAATIPVVFRRHMAAPPGSSAGCQNLVCAIAGNGIKIAVVSNCDENTRDLLVELGVAALADALVLSCEVGAAKPAQAIFHRALDQLGVAAEAAVFVDDQPRYCAGAAVLGMSAVQILRGGSDGRVVWDGEVVRSLREVEAMLLAARRFDRAGGEVSGHVPNRGAGVMWRLDQMSQGETGRQLAADLLRQRMAILNRAIAVAALAFGAGQVRGGKGDPVAYDELLSRIERLDVED